MTLTATSQKIAVQQQTVLRRTTVPPAPKTVRRFSVWNGVSINPRHLSVRDIADAIYALKPAGQWDEIEWLVKAGEGGSWQGSWDPHHLAIGSATDLGERWNEAFLAGIRLSPYVVVRARAAWIADEQAMIRECVRICGRCVLNVEPGSQYYNGPLDPGFIRGYLGGIGVRADALEVCLIPRQAQVDELGGPACIAAWTDPHLVGSASWEVYDAVAGGAGPTSLRPDVAIPRLDGWGVPPGLEYRLCVVQRSRIADWAATAWAVHGLEVWQLDGD